MDVINQVVGWLAGIVWGAFDSVGAWIIGFLPDADSTIMNAISGWTYILQGHDIPFNLYYFVDMQLMVWFLAMWAGVTIAGLIVMVVRFVLDLVHKVMDSIPVIG